MIKSLHLFFVGIVFLLIFSFYKVNETTRLSFNDSLPLSLESIDSESMPVNISIEKTKVDLPIYPTVIRNGTWQISNKGISYLVSSSRPGQQGSIILYGHNTNDRFGPIRWLEVNDKIEVTTEDEQITTYTVSEVMIVNPSQVNYLVSDSETLILYTCTGLLDSKRFIVKALPQLIP